MAHGPDPEYPSTIEKHNIMKEQKILVAYFTQKGKEDSTNCARLAAQTEKLLKDKGITPDMFAIVPVETYPSDSEEFKAVTKLEKERRVRPEIVGKYSGMKHITGVILIAPNWWDSLPQAVLTWLDDYDFADTKVVPVISTTDDAKNVHEELRHFLQNWVLPGVDVKDTDTDNATEQLEKAISQLIG